ncbi:hypothetical protein ACOI1H_16155 [Loktanella sp. DJP18]
MTAIDQHHSSEKMQNTSLGWKLKANFVLMTAAFVIACTWAIAAAV